MECQGLDIGGMFIYAKQNAQMQMSLLQNLWLDAKLRLIFLINEVDICTLRLLTCQ